LLRQRGDHAARHYARITLIDLFIGGVEFAGIDAPQQSVDLCQLPDIDWNLGSIYHRSVVGCCR
jgi:hypothetical protein